jgi:hypothetical protein
MVLPYLEVSCSSLFGGIRVPLYLQWSGFCFISRSLGSPLFREDIVPLCLEGSGFRFLWRGQVYALFGWSGFRFIWRGHGSTLFGGVRGSIL